MNRAAGRQISLDVSSGKEVIFRQVVSLPKDRRSQTITFSHNFSRAGETQLQARLSADSLKVDDIRYLCLPVRDSIRVLAVRGKPGADRYLKHALQSQTSRGPAVKLTVKDESALSNAPLMDFDCLFLCNIGRFNKIEAGRLRRYLDSGGAIVFFLGDQVQADSYNQSLGGAQRPLLPVRVRQPSKVGEYYFDTLAFNHPLLIPFARTGRNLLSAIPTWRYVQCETIGPDARIALGYTSGDPAIVEARKGRGRVIVFTSDASLASTFTEVDSGESSPWTALPLYQGFAPIARQTLHLSLAGHQQLRNVLVGQPIGGAISVKSAKSVILTDDQQRSEQIDLQVVDEQGTWSYLPKHSGVFTRSYEQTGQQLFAVNVNSEGESSLDRVAIADVATLFHESTEEEQRITAAPASTTRPALYRYCLGLVFILLCIEPLIAWRFGNQ